MLRLLLITTGSNQVLSALRETPHIELCIVDCAIREDVIECMRKEVQTEFISQFTPDMILTYRCPYILTRDAFSIPRGGAYNLHPSLLPQYKGLNPWEAIFRNKETVGGVTLHRITEEVDAGDIVSQRKFTICSEKGVEVARREADCIAAKLVTDWLQHLLPLLPLL